MRQAQINLLLQEHRRPLASSLHSSAAAKPLAPPRTSLSVNKPPRRGQTRPESECESTSAAESTVATPAPLDRHRSLHVPVTPLEGSPLTRHRPRMVGNDDYSEVGSPEVASGGGEAAADLVDGPARSGRSGSGDSGLTGLSSVGSSGAAAGSAPPPPAHRYPSWEDRIYQVASEGLGDAEGEVGNGGNTRNSLCGFGDDINVPVYASVKGVSIGERWPNVIFMHIIDLYNRFSLSERGCPCIIECIACITKHVSSFSSHTESQSDSLRALFGRIRRRRRGRGR